MAARTRKPAAQNGPPKAMMRGQVAKKIMERLAAIQEVRTEYEGMQIAGDMKPTDAIPGMPPKVDEDGSVRYEDGKPVFTTFGEVYAENDAGQARVWDWAEREGVKTLVERMIAVNLERESMLEGDEA